MHACVHTIYSYSYRPLASMHAIAMRNAHNPAHTKSAEVRRSAKGLYLVLKGLFLRISVKITASFRTPKVFLVRQMVRQMQRL